MAQSISPVPELATSVETEELKNFSRYTRRFNRGNLRKSGSLNSWTNLIEDEESLEWGK